mmetsp:Transcript_11173/g.33501  ORF Transcript_11173/g.33501 Transcript_11173/m.33501 type:complete len:304 (-) Transcript_11173:2305-3216(-)
MLGAFGSVAGAAALRKKGSLKERRGPEAFERGSLFPTLLPQGMAMLYVGKVADTTGRRGALLLGLAWFVAGTLGSIGSPTPDWRCVMAWGQSAAIACDAIARDVLDDPEERVQVLTVISAFRLVGLALAPTVGALVRDAYGWRALFAALAAVGVLLAILTALLIPETLHEGQQSSPRVVAAAGTRQKSEPEEEEDDDAGGGTKRRGAQDRRVGRHVAGESAGVHGEPGTGDEAPRRARRPHGRTEQSARRQVRRPPRHHPHHRRTPRPRHLHPPQAPHLPPPPHDARRRRRPLRNPPRPHHLR